jgi:hypothetical protein
MSKALAIWGVMSLAAVPLVLSSPARAQDEALVKKATAEGVVTI